MSHHKCHTMPDNAYNHRRTIKLHRILKSAREAAEPQRHSIPTCPEFRGHPPRIPPVLTRCSSGNPLLTARDWSVTRRFRPYLGNSKLGTSRDILTLPILCVFTLRAFSRGGESFDG